MGGRDMQPTADLMQAGGRMEHGVLVLDSPPALVAGLAVRLKTGFGFDLLLDVTAVDWPQRAPRFDVLWHFYSTQNFMRVRVKAQVDEATAVPTLTHLYGSARFAERECHEMFGIGFDGNDDLRPLLLYEGFIGHPLRKDYDQHHEQPLVPLREPLPAAFNHGWGIEAADADQGIEGNDPAALGIERANTVTRSELVHAPRDDDGYPNPIRPAFTASRDDSVIVNIGPSHPATHGTVQVVAELQGEKILRTDVHCGYLHRGFEKECESHTWHNLIPYVDRLNYCSALLNDFAYCDAVEQLMGIEITPRCRYLRTLLGEYSRVADHLTCIAASLMELGAMTAFLYLVTIRDSIYEHLADVTGARVTYSFGRIGGLARDLPPGWLERLEKILVEHDEFTGRVHALVDRNRIFIDRMRGIGQISTAEAINWGFTGPMLRSTGAARDLRKDRPYLAYPELDFEVPVGIQGDNYDRYVVRMREMDESIHMIRQLVDLLAEHGDTPLNVDDRRCTLPPKHLVYGEIESLINHFKLVIDGPRVPPGEIYVAHEGANGELGFYLVSSPASAGPGNPYRVHVRSPSFYHMGGAHRLFDGYQLADMVPTFGSINMIGGECDR
jgi:NADH-quinone oxidoreductase subunit D